MITLVAFILSAAAAEPNAAPVDEMVRSTVRTVQGVQVARALDRAEEPTVATAYHCVAGSEGSSCRA